MTVKHTTAEDMASLVGVDADAFRAALRSAKIRRKRSTDWEVQIDSPAYSEMRSVLASLLPRKAA